MDEECGYPECRCPATVVLVRYYYGAEYDDEYIASCEEHVQGFLDDGAILV